MKKRKIILFRTFAILLGVLTAIVAAEVLCRVFEPPPTDSPPRSLHTRMNIRPFTMLHYTANVRSESATTNRLGYRGTVETPEYPDQVPEKAKRTVILTGGSAAFGQVVKSDEEALAVQLETILSADAPTEVINLGMGGYNSFAQFVAVARYGMMRSPDLVVVMDGYNDIILHCHSGYRQPPGYPMYFGSIRKALLCYRAPDFGFTDQHSWAGLLKRSALLRRVMHARYVPVDQVEGEQERRAGATKISDENARRIVDFYRYSEDMLMRLTGSSDCPVLLATQPLRDYPGKADPNYKWLGEAFRLYPQILEAGRSVCDQWDHATYMDLTTALPPPNADFFEDMVHLNARGQRKVAEILAAKIASDGLLDDNTPLDKGN